MNPSNETSGTASDVKPVPAANPVDAACRFSVLSLMSKGAGWLAVAFLFEWVNAIKLVFPGFIANCPWVTYGVLDAAAYVAFIYGFALQSGFGLVLWIQSRLSNTRFAWPVYLTMGLGIWNLGVLVSVLGIMGGDASGFAGLAMPAYGAYMLLLGYFFIGGSCLVHFHLRRRGELYVSQWYGLGVLFWFPWILSIAILTLFLKPGNGVMQSIAAAWFSRNLEVVCLFAIALAILYYVVPKALEKNVPSRALAHFGFWSLFIVGGWGGLNQGAPTPSWYSVLHTVSGVAIIIPVAAVAANLWPVCRGEWRRFRSDRGLLLAGVSLLSLAAVAVFDFLTSCRVASAFGEMTLAATARDLLAHYGFLGFAVFAGGRWFVSKAVDGTVPDRRCDDFHLAGSVVGLAILTISLLIGGILQSLVFYIPGAPFEYSVKYAKPFLFLNIIGWGVLFAAQLAYMAQWCRLWMGQYCGCCLPARFKANKEVSMNSVTAVEA